MPPLAALDFPVTREIIAQLPNWVSAFAAALPRPERATLPDGNFRWEHPVKDAKTLQVAKAVRVASGLRAAMHLADMRHTTEVMVLLRTVSDFASEIHFVSEGLIAGSLTKEQEQFVTQHFEPPPVDPEELVARDRAFYVGRKAIAKSLRRIAEKFGDTAERLVNVTAFLNKGYDGFVHGAYHATMELFTGRNFRFMMSGHESDSYVCFTKIAVAGKLKEGLNALRSMAIAWNRPDLNLELRAAFDRLDASKEDTRGACSDITQ